MILLYYVLLAVWPLLLWPALRLKGWSRGWLIVTAVVGALATAHEVRMFLGPPAAIRLDVYLIAMVLGVLYAGAAAVLFLGRRRKSAAVVGFAIVLIGGGMSYLSIEAGRQTERLTAAFYAGQALLFEAKFRSPEAYAAYYRMFDARPTLAPVGHWGGPRRRRLFHAPDHQSGRPRLGVLSLRPAQPGDGMRLPVGRCRRAAGR